MTSLRLAVLITLIAGSFLYASDGPDEVRRLVNECEAARSDACSALAKIAGTTADPASLGTIAAGSNDRAVLVELAQNIYYSGIRKAALDKLNDPQSLLHLAKLGGGDVPVAAVSKLSDPDALAEVIRSGTADNVREIAIQRLNDDRRLLDAMQSITNRELFLVATRHLTEPDALAAVAGSVDDVEIRNTAAERLLEALDTRCRGASIPVESWKKPRTYSLALSPVFPQGTPDEAAALGMGRQVASFFESRLGAYGVTPVESGDGVPELRIVLVGSTLMARYGLAGMAVPPGQDPDAWGSRSYPGAWWGGFVGLVLRNGCAASRIVSGGVPLPERIAQGSYSRPGDAPHEEALRVWLARAWVALATEFGGAGEAARLARSDSDPRVRLAAVESVPDADVLGAVAASDPDPAVRAAAAKRLGQPSSPE